MAEKPEREISEKQKRFVREWLTDFNGTRAAVRAGYSEKSAAQTASRLMKDPAVQAYRNQLLKQEYAALGVTRHSLATEVWRMMQECRGGAPHMVWNSATREYEPDGTWEQNEKGFYKGAELLLKLLEAVGSEDGADGGGYEALTGGKCDA